MASFDWQAMNLSESVLCPCSNVPSIWVRVRGLCEYEKISTDLRHISHCPSSLPIFKDLVQVFLLASPSCQEDLYFLCWVINSWIFSQCLCSCHPDLRASFVTSPSFSPPVHSLPNSYSSFGSLWWRHLQKPLLTLREWDGLLRSALDRACVFISAQHPAQCLVHSRDSISTCWRNQPPANTQCVVWPDD